MNDIPFCVYLFFSSSPSVLFVVYYQFVSLSITIRDCNHVYLDQYGICASVRVRK